MRVLLLGNSLSPYLPTLARSLQGTGAEVDVFDFLRGELVGAGGRSQPLGQWGRVRSLRSFLSKAPALPWDVINLHYVSPAYRFALGPLRRSGRVLVSSVWGFDLAGAGGIARCLQRDVYQASARITFNNPERKQRFRERFPHVASESRLAEAYLPMGLFREMDRVASQESREAQLESLGLPADARVVVCGSNGSPAQQHALMVDALRLAVEALPPQAHFVFPMTYGATPEYRTQLESDLNALPIEARVLSTFMDEQMVARLRGVSDLFVLLQREDSFSAALQESFYAGAHVIVGDWLPYRFLSDAGLRFTSVRSAHDLADGLKDALLERGAERSASIASRNRDRIRKLAAEADAGRSWRTLYEAALSESA